MKTLILAAIRCSLMFTAVAAVSFVHSAQAYTVTLEQMGPDVVANGSGPINLTGLTFVGPFSNFSAISPSNGLIRTGPAGFAIYDSYRGFTGPASFGTGFPGTFANSGTGDLVGIANGPLDALFVPPNYQSGAALTSSSTWTNATFASLGVTPGTYVWTWGTGYRTRTSRSSSEALGFPMAARQFLYSVSVCSAWVPCGAN